MNERREAALARAAAAGTPDEIERAMMTLAVLPNDAEVEAARAALSRALDAATRSGGAARQAKGRMADMTLNPGFDNN